uniref:DUF4393 domain-containing protein n=1 Tax=Candidatus Kentrum eta TaxID=2126337 RepID=A0A450UVR9_9GAMM|nr:MAG: hypothetical protein BECKH772A_GA0070896_1000745 [Candidatus Kentron sp. H]VFJ90263.1 MAG: hypothetical protein BECKH772B_GA0070898_1000845 [Candidatus Kentron sp. H]VFJ96617.1 MAG: hypothetical protein BECKH772C_GA0070978_1000745 [Candidatus Kentron sp. H]
MAKTDIAKVEAGGDTIAHILVGDGKKKYGRFVLAALGSIPWVGGAIAASTALHSEFEQGRMNEMYARWLDEHHEKINLLQNTIQQIVDRLEQFEGDMADEVERRLNDEQYLALARRGFRAWDRSDTNEKRDYIRRCIANAAATRICSDDVVRLFLDWINKYDEIHFAVIRALYQNRGATRAYIWDQIHGEDVREDSAEADLYKLLIFDLNTGRVLRQIRDKNTYGQFLSKRRQDRQPRKPVLESAFENTKPYELTELGSQFVHYVMNEVVPKVGDGS